MPIQDVSELFVPNRELFVPNRIGCLLKMEENEQTRFQFEVWSEYTRQTMTQLREGTLLAVKNFATNQSETHYTILEITSIMPIHYALGESPEGYPGFVMEAARNIAIDWIAQEEHSQEDTTIIRGVATPTGLEIAESLSGRSIQQEKALPMIGSDVRVPVNEATREIINRAISPERDMVFEGGEWLGLVDSSLPIYIRAEDFIRVHFGIFGFTGVGKSNIVSTYVAKLLRTLQEQRTQQEQQRRHSVKIVLFDLMSEYSVLLVDQLLSLQDAYVLGIGESTFPGSVIEFLSGRGERERASSDLLNTGLYPKSLESVRENFRSAFDSLLQKNKIRLYKEPKRTVRDFLQEKEASLTHGNLGNSQSVINTFIENMKKSENDLISTDFVQSVIKAVDKLIRGGPPGVITLDIAETSKGRPTRCPLNSLLGNIQIPKGGLAPPAINNLRVFEKELEKEKHRVEKTYSPDTVLSLETIIEHLNNGDNSSLFIIQSYDPDALRNFASTLGDRLLENRRASGTTSPLVSFVFDEADEFIRQQYDKESSYARSTGVAERLARRGRKFGVGIGICTQRTRYLNTSVMAQPHTYLVSKMPRLTDREAIQEAFGVSKEMFRQTFRFAPGDWILISYDAPGLKAIPIPIHAEDANARIHNFLKKQVEESSS